MYTRLLYFCLTLFLLFNLVSCSALLFNQESTIDPKYIQMAENEAMTLRARGVSDPYDPKVARAYSAGQRIFSTVQAYLLEKKKESLLSDLRFEVIVLNDPKMDCYTLGAGKIVIHLGLLEQLTSEDEVAYLIAHELAHDIDKHSYKKLKSPLLAQLGSALISSVVSPEDRSRDLYLSAFGVTNSAIGGIKFSSQEEEDADGLALLLVAKARYNPKAAIAAITTLEQLARNGFKVTFIEIHPTNDALHKRIEVLADKYFREYFLFSVQ